LRSSTFATCGTSSTKTIQNGREGKNGSPINADHVIKRTRPVPGRVFKAARIAAVTFSAFPPWMTSGETVGVRVRKPAAASSIRATVG